MAAVVRGLGLGADSVDYRGMDDPLQRVQKLIAAGEAQGAPPVLVGSSLGGHVAAAAAARLRARGLFLLAPAFYMPGFEDYTPRTSPVPRRSCMAGAMTSCRSTTACAGRANSARRCMCWTPIIDWRTDRRDLPAARGVPAFFAAASGAQG